jgi:hypothetical protein
MKGCAESFRLARGGLVGQRESLSLGGDGDTQSLQVGRTAIMSKGMREATHSHQH